MGIFSKNEESQVYFAALSPEDQERISAAQIKLLNAVVPFAVPITFASLVDAATSLYRSPDFNRREGGSPRSRHCTGAAGDWPAGIFPKLKGGTRDKFIHFGGLAWYHFKGRNTGQEYIHIETVWRKKEKKE